MPTTLTAEALIAHLGMQPLHAEGGYFVETYRANSTVKLVPGVEERAASTAIYYLLTDSTSSRMHRLRSDEVWHFYVGDPVEMVQLSPDGQGRVIRLGHDLTAGQVCQVVVPGGTWQGARLLPGGRWALMGCTVAPGFEFSDFEPGDKRALIDEYPTFRARIEVLA